MTAVLRIGKLGVRAKTLARLDLGIRKLFESHAELVAHTDPE